jgi:PAT family beta-lactamase induction signal transducer AmpG
MTDEKVDLGVIGIFSLVGLPYTLKFVWAPFTDRFTPSSLGRRRGWILPVQIILAMMIGGLGFADPSESLYAIALLALGVTLFSSSQDTVLDAYRREYLDDEELGLGTAIFINGYRIAMLVSGAGALLLADHVSWDVVYWMMASLMVVGIGTTIFMPEPEIAVGTPKTFKESVVQPFVEFFKRDGAFLILGFFLFYKIGDSMAAAMTTPFILVDYSKTELAMVAKLFGFWATIGGGLLGGIIMLKKGIFNSLWIFGILQAISTAGFSALAIVGHSIPALAAVIAFENLSGGMGTAAFSAYMASLCNKRFTATQYALFTSIMVIPRVIASAPTGYMAKAWGWEAFFIFCAIIAIPGLILLKRLGPKGAIERRENERTS